ncbi:GD12779 [Drosophila simulans]|uniref:GD12779 n=1 Tax=Drosophila simulans TaxID=7240 RepID=B4QQM3_DROSI|nr:GD12779 [Drosophila simulans]
MLLMPTSCGPGPPTDHGPMSLPTSSSSCPNRARIPTRAADDDEPVRRSGTLTQRQSSGSGIPQWLLILIGLLAILAQTPGSQVAAEKSKHLHHTADTNGSSKHLHYHGISVGGTLTREHTQLPTSGNWHHPAGPSGYHRTPHNYLKMATKVRPICQTNIAGTGHPNANAVGAAQKDEWFLNSNHKMDTRRSTKTRDVHK